MARRPRIQYCGAIYHVMSRGNRKSLIFEDDQDRRQFLVIVSEALERYGARGLTFTLMGNHYHWILQTPRGNVSLVMRHINGVYTQYSNRRHGRTGHVFEGRFKSPVVEDGAYLRTAIKYVVLNPAVAGLVGDLADWEWGSYRATAGFEEPAPFLNLDWLDGMFGCSSRTDAQLCFRQFIAQADDATDDISDENFLGSPSFKAGIRNRIGLTLYRRSLPRAYRALSRPPLAQLFDGIAFRREERDRMIRRAHVLHGYLLSEIADFLALHPNTMSKVLRRLREQRLRREEPGSDD